MLILAREVGQEIVIGEEDPETGQPPIVVKVVEILAGKVRFGVTAERKIPVHRREVWERIKAEGPQARSA